MNSTSKTERPHTRWLVATLTLTLTVALAACSSNNEGSAAEPPVAIALDGESESSPDSGVAVAEAISPPASAVVAPTTSTTIAVTTTTTTEPEPDIEDLIVPGELTGAVAAPISGLVVNTSPGDPLNVRSGPGIGYGIVGELEHEFEGLGSTHFYVIESGAVWRFVQIADDDLGWVNSEYLAGVANTASCTQSADFPEFEGAVVVRSGDVDLDGLDDEVFLFAEEQTTAGRYNGWVLVSFGNGGVVTGEWTDFFEPTPVTSMNIFDLTTLDDPEDYLEIVFQVGQGASHAQWGVMTLAGCRLVPTTLDDVPFSFSDGASAGHSTVGGCAYGTHGKIEFVITSQNFNAGDWTQSTYELRGTAWTQLESFDETDFPGLDHPSVISLSDCEGFEINDG